MEREDRKDLTFVNVVILNPPPHHHHHHHHFLGWIIEKYEYLKQFCWCTAKLSTWSPLFYITTTNSNTKVRMSKWYFMMQKYEADQSTTLSCPLLPTNYKLILVFNYFHNWSLSINNHLDDCVFSCLVFLSTTNINAKKSVTCWAEKYAEIYTSQCYIFPIFKVRDLISKFQKIGELKNGLKFFV